MTRLSDPTALSLASWRQFGPGAFGVRGPAQLLSLLLDKTAFADDDGRQQLTAAATEKVSMWIDVLCGRQQFVGKKAHPFLVCTHSSCERLLLSSAARTAALAANMRTASGWGSSCMAQEVVERRGAVLGGHFAQHGQLARRGSRAFSRKNNAATPE